LFHLITYSVTKTCQENERERSKRRERDKKRKTTCVYQRVKEHMFTTEPPPHFLSIEVITMKYTLAVVFLLSSCSAYTPKPLTRRSLVSGLSSAFLVAGAAGVAQAEESLLSQFGNDSKNITPKASTRDVGGGKVMVGKSEGSIDPNLRANYYYPTARKVRRRRGPSTVGVGDIKETNPSPPTLTKYSATCPELRRPATRFPQFRIK